MYGQIGSWDEGLAVHLDDHALSWLDAQGTDRYISIMIEGRSISVCPDNNQPHLRRRVANKGKGAHVDYQFGATFDHPAQTKGSEDWPRFSLCEVKFLMGNDNLYLYAELPSHHMLPWPKLRECASYDVPTQIVRDLELRMNSAKAAFPGTKPAQWTWVPMPEKYRGMLAKGVYGDCLKAVIAGEPYAVPA